MSLPNRDHTAQFAHPHLPIALRINSQSTNSLAKFHTISMRGPPKAKRSSSNSCSRTIPQRMATQIAKRTPRWKLMTKKTIRRMSSMKVDIVSNIKDCSDMREVNQMCHEANEMDMNSKNV